MADGNDSNGAGIGGGAAAGATLGTIAGPLGTVAGAAIGGIIGGIVSKKHDKRVDEANREAREWTANREDSALYRQANANAQLGFNPSAEGYQQVPAPASSDVPAYSDISSYGSAVTNAVAAAGNQYMQGARMDLDFNNFTAQSSQSYASFMTGQALERWKTTQSQIDSTRQQMLSYSTQIESTDKSLSNALKKSQSELVRSTKSANAALAAAISNSETKEATTAALRELSAEFGLDYSISAGGELSVSAIPVALGAKAHSEMSAKTSIDIAGKIAKNVANKHNLTEEQRKELTRALTDSAERMRSMVNEASTINSHTHSKSFQKTGLTDDSYLDALSRLIQLEMDADRYQKESSSDAYQNHYNYMYNQIKSSRR